MPYNAYEYETPPDAADLMKYSVWKPVQDFLDHFPSDLAIRHVEGSNGDNRTVRKKSIQDMCRKCLVETLLIHMLITFWPLCIGMGARQA